MGQTYKEGDGEARRSSSPNRGKRIETLERSGVRAGSVNGIVVPAGEADQPTRVTRRLGAWIFAFIVIRVIRAIRGCPNFGCALALKSSPELPLLISPFLPKILPKCRN